MSEPVPAPLPAIQVRRELRRMVDPHIYRRGTEYFQSGAVIELKSTVDSRANVSVRGKVKGSKVYDVYLQFTKNGVCTASTCTCPYDIGCKHMVALGLAATIGSAMQEGDMEGADSGAQGAGNGGAGSGHEAGTRPFNPRAYCIVLHTWRGCIPTFHLVGMRHQDASLRTVLERADVGESERAVLEYLREGKFGHPGAGKPDLAVLIPLLAAAAFPIFIDGHAADAEPVDIDLSPKPISAQFLYKKYIHQWKPELVRHELRIRLPGKYWRDPMDSSEAPFHLSGAHLVRLTRRTLELHTLTPMLATLIARVRARPALDTERGIHGRALPAFETVLSGREIEQYEEIANDAERLLSITGKLPRFKVEVMPAPKETLLVEYDAQAHTLRVVPVVDYGNYQADVSETIYAARTYLGAKMQRRSPWEHPGTHAIVVEGDELRIAEFDEPLERAFFRDLTADATALGFTKRLKSSLKGEKKLRVYLQKEWPRLLSFAEKKGYTVVFTKDELALSQATFRADFQVDLDAQKDWLHFDVSLYCGEERISLETLRAFVKSGEAFLRREDGTLVEIDNREELERLLYTLESFRASEQGGFEGKLYRAPELRYVMTSSSHYTSAQAEGFSTFLKGMETGRSVEAKDLPDHFEKTMRPYQKEGVHWLYFLRKYRFAGILADDMGLGKTLQALALMSAERVEGAPSIVVCPKTLLYNWQREAAHFAPELRVAVVEGKPGERAAIIAERANYDLLVVSYSTLRQDADLYDDPAIRFNYAILDEAQFIKNHATKNAQIAKKIHADYRLALTGTPLENGVSELWSVFDFLMPEFLGSHERFMRQFHKPIMEKGDVKALEQLKRKVEYFMLRRTKREVLSELPPKIEQISECELGTAQNILYQDILERVRSEVYSAVHSRGFKGAQIHILAGLTKLRQVCNHPALLLKDKEWKKHDSAKLELCLELIDEIVAEKRKVLVFSQFTQMLDIVAHALKERGVRYSYLSGKTQNRQELVDEFNTDPEISVFLISLKAGGTGLNLTAADAVIIYDPWWNPQVEHQAVDRAHRMGQKQSVNVYRLITRGTIEEKIQELQKKKGALFDALVGESGDVFKKLTWEDVRQLFM